MEKENADWPDIQWISSASLASLFGFSSCTCRAIPQIPWHGTTLTNIICMWVTPSMNGNAASESLSSQTMQVKYQGFQRLKLPSFSRRKEVTGFNTCLPSTCSSRLLCIKIWNSDASMASATNPLQESKSAADISHTKETQRI